MNISDVHSVAIYPPIGVARVGNSPNEYFLGSIIPGIPAQDPDDFRDAQGRIKRQGAKYFIFGLDAEGNILGELNDSHGVKIDWRVDVANKKAAWYDFDIALDTPTAEGVYDMDG
ncbi:MAG: LodA/GoxA family CTQ-dependent oxidase, partial [Bacteroidota bacterium]